MGRGFRLEVIGYDGAKHSIRAVGDRAEAQLDGAVAAGAALVANNATGRLRSGYLLLTGTLRRSIQARRTGRGRGRISYDVGPRGVPYAAIHEYGGTIYPRGPYLVFTIGGALIFARSVTIPARPYMRPAFDATRAAVPAEVARVLGQAVRP